MATRDSGFELRFTGVGVLGDALRDSLDALDAMGLPERHRHRLAVLIEELLANQFEHGCCGGDALIRLVMRRAADHVVLVLEDGGTPFDPLAADPDAPVPERGGGAGLALVRAWAEALSYQAGPEVNRLELRYSLEPAS